MTELSFHGINTSSFESEAKSVTHVSGTKRHLCLGSLTLNPATFRPPEPSETTEQTAKATAQKRPHSCAVSNPVPGLFRTASRISQRLRPDVLSP
jgi:hypothetical protein